VPEIAADKGKRMLRENKWIFAAITPGNNEATSIESAKALDRSVRQV
jgi:hypothetical protein